MAAFRAFILQHGCAAILAVAIVLCMKALLPAGYMLGSATEGGSSRFLVLTLCSGREDGPATARIALPATGKHQDGSATDEKGGGQCAYSVLSMAVAGSAPAVLLALALAFVLMLGFGLVCRLPLGPIAHLRPPLRGPPAVT